MLTLEVGSGECPVNGNDTFDERGSTATSSAQHHPSDSANTLSVSTQEPWINGLRGLAALQVMLFHYITPEAFFIYESAWVKPEHPGPRILKLIPVRLLAQGDAMARFFFVLSGYCIALSFRKETKNVPTIQYYRRLTSAVFWTSGTRSSMTAAMASGVCLSIYDTRSERYLIGTRYFSARHLLHRPMTVAHSAAE